MTFTQELAIEAIQMRVADLKHTITHRCGVSAAATEALRAIDTAIAPLIAAIMAKGE